MRQIRAGWTASCRISCATRRRTAEVWCGSRSCVATAAASSRSTTPGRACQQATVSAAWSASPAENRRAGQDPRRDGLGLTFVAELVTSQHGEVTVPRPARRRRSVRRPAPAGDDVSGNVERRRRLGDLVLAFPVLLSACGVQPEPRPQPIPGAVRTSPSAGEGAASTPAPVTAPPQEVLARARTGAATS